MDSTKMDCNRGIVTSSRLMQIFFHKLPWFYDPETSVLTYIQ